MIPSLPRPRRFRASAWCLLLLAWIGLGIPAHAGSETEAPSPEATPSAGEGAAPEHGFSLVVTAPARFTTSAVRESTGIAVSDKPDTYVDPDAFLGWKHQSSAFLVSAAVGVRLDRYRRTAEADLSTVLGRFKLALTDGGSDLFVPYVTYRPTLDYGRDFRTRIDALHDLGGGFTSAFGLDADLKPIPYRDTTEPGQTVIALDLRGGRRLAAPRELEGSFLIATLDMSHNLTEDLTVSLTPSLIVRWYDDYFGGGRRDVLPGAWLRAGWSPGWLQRLLPRSELSLGVAYYRNVSTIRGMGYKQWEVGPTLEFAYRF